MDELLHKEHTCARRSFVLTRVQLDAYLLVLTLGMGLANQTLVPVLSVLGQLSLQLAGVVAAARVAASKIRFSLLLFVIQLWGPLFLVYALNLYSYGSARGFRTAAQLATAVLVFFWSAKTRWSTEGLSALAVLRYFLVGFAIVQVGFDSYNPYQRIWSNPNGAGEAMLTCIYLLVLARAGGAVAGGRRYHIVLLLCAAILAFSRSRASILSLLVFVCCYAGWPLVTRSRFRFYLAFCMVILTGFAAVYVVLISGPGSEIAAQYQEVVLERTGKDLNTRFMEWSYVVPAILENPWSGLGLGHLAAEISGTRDYISSHNQYLELGINTGFPGIIALLVLILGLWGAFWRGRRHPVSRVAASMLLSIMVQQVFEVNLLQNGLAFGLIWWVLLGIGVHSSLWSQQAKALHDGGRPNCRNSRMNSG